MRPPVAGRAYAGTPEPPLYQHRPLNDMLNAFTWRPKVFWGIFLFLAMALYPLKEVSGEDKARYFEIGIGAGTDMMHGLGTEQAMIAPAINLKINDVKSLWFRLEGDLELINDDRRLTFVAGATPMLRLYFFADQNKPGFFIEGGAGINLISRNTIGNRELGGVFIFSDMAGVGYKFIAGKTPLFLTYRYRHLSNLCLYSHNNGLDSHYLMLSIGF